MPLINLECRRIGLPPQAKLDDDDSDEINDNSDYDIDDDSNGL